MIGSLIHITGIDRRTGARLLVNGIVRAEEGGRVIVEFIDGADDGNFVEIPASRIQNEPPPGFHDDEPEPGEGWKH